MGLNIDGIPAYDWDAHLDRYSARPDPVLDWPHWTYPLFRSTGRVTYDELRAIHAEIFPPRCTCSLGRCTIHPAEPTPRPPTLPGVADIAVRALLTAGP